MTKYLNLAPRNFCQTITYKRYLEFLSKHFYLVLEKITLYFTINVIWRRCTSDMCLKEPLNKILEILVCYGTDIKSIQCVQWGTADDVWCEDLFILRIMILLFQLHPFSLLMLFSWIQFSNTHNNDKLQIKANAQATDWWHSLMSHSFHRNSKPHRWILVVT